MEWGFDRRFALGGLAVSAAIAIAGLGVTILWPEKKELGWALLWFAAIVFFAWICFEIFQWVGRNWKSFLLSGIAACVVFGGLATLQWKANMKNEPSTPVLQPQVATNQSTPPSPKPTIPPSTPIPPSGRSKIEVIDFQQVPLVNKDTGLHSACINIFYADTGNLPVIAMSRGLAVRLKASDLTPEQEKGAEEESLRVKAPDPEDLVNGMQPGREPPRHLFTFPNNDQDRFVPLIQAVLDGKTRLYLFHTFKYRDASLPRGMIRITQSCGWFSQSLEVAHNCGINRVYTARIK
jgi:hypothetical protein